MNTSYKAIQEEYGIWLDTLGYSENEVYNGKFYVRDFFEWLESKQVQNVTQITAKHITDYHDYLEKRPNKRFKGRLLSATKLNHNFITIDKLLEFLHQYGMKNDLIPLNRRIKTDKLEQMLKVKVLTQQEVKTLYNCIPETYSHLTFAERQPKQYELKLIFALYYACGLRRSEGYNLQIKDVDFDRKTVFVRQGKNYKDRIIPMNNGVYRELQDYIYNYRNKLKLKHNRLFPTTKYTINARLKHLQNTCNDENIKAKHLTLHTLRHSIATHLLQNGMSIENISMFLGHSTLDTTQLYTHLI